MNRIDRLNAIMIHLQGKSRVPLDELEERFEVGRRTVFRDIRSLIDAGVPIGGNAGEGYFIVEGYHLPPVVFNKDEAAALLMGAKFLEKNADSYTIEAFKQAMYKVKAVLKFSDKEFLENLDERVSIRPGIRSENEPDDHIKEIQTAVANNKVIAITYNAHYSEQVTSREVEPLGMVFYSSHWHLIGFCRLRQALRDFRTDRIQCVEVQGETFDPSKHPNYLSFIHDSLVGTDAKEVTIRATRMASRFMGEQKYFQGFVEERKIGKDQIEMKFVVPYYEYFARWMLMYGTQIKIVSPPDLQDLVHHLIEELAEHHGAPVSKLEMG